MFLFFFFFKQKTAYEMRISDWSSDVCSSDLGTASPGSDHPGAPRQRALSSTRRLRRRDGGGARCRSQRFWRHLRHQGIPGVHHPHAISISAGGRFRVRADESFTFLGRAAASERFRLRQKQMENADDRAVSQMLDLVDAADDLMSNRFVLGDHHFTLAVYSDSLKSLRDNMSIARAALADTGMVAAREGAALEAAYWSQLVGNFAWRARPAPITSLNFARSRPSIPIPLASPRGTI